MLVRFFSAQYASTPSPPPAIGPLIQGRTMRFEAHERHGVPARIRDPLRLHDDDGPHPDAASTGKVLGQRREVIISSSNHPSPSVNADDPRWSLEGTEHQYDPPVLPKMGDRLHAAAGLVQIGDMAFVEDHQLLTVALW